MPREASWGANNVGSIRRPVRRVMKELEYALPINAVPTAHVDAASNLLLIPYFFDLIPQKRLADNAERRLQNKRDRDIRCVCGPYVMGEDGRYR